MNLSKLRPKVIALKKRLGAFQAKLNKTPNKSPKARKPADPPFFSKKDFLNGLLEAQYCTRKALVGIFGSQKIWSRRSAPMLGDLFEYGTTDDSEGLLLAYYEPVGDGIEAATNEVDKRFREEVFMKGHRWSDLKRKHEFYIHLERVADLLGTKEFPLDFWKSYSGASHVSVRARGVPTREAPTTEPHVVCMPHVSDADGTWGEHLPQCKKLWESIARAKQPDEKFVSIREDFSAAEQELNSAAGKKHLLDPFLAHLRELGWMDTILQSANIFNLICLYHCYDSPYTVDVFWSTDNGPLSPPKSVLALTRKRTCPALDSDEVAFLREICETVGMLHDIERSLATKRQNHVRLFWQLERTYLKEVPKYRRLLDTLKLVLGAACEADGIEVQSINGRLKDPESLFTKLCDWSNGSQRRGGRSPVDWQRATKRVDIEFIKQHMPDLAGMRIVCVYESDLKRVREIIAELVANGHLVERGQWSQKKMVKWHESGGHIISGYRAWHLDISLGTERLQLIECKGLDDLICEIQLKSAAAQAWSEAAHPMIYKPELPENILKSSKADQLQFNMLNAAINFKDADDRVNAARMKLIKLTCH